MQYMEVFGSMITSSLVGYFMGLYLGPMFGAFMGMMIGIGMFIFLVKFFEKNWPVTVVGVEKRGLGYRWFFDRAKRFKRKDKTEAFVLKNKKEEMPPPSYEHIGIDNEGKSVLALFSPQSEQYSPMKISNPGGLGEGLIPEDKEMSFWHTLQIRRTHEMYAQQKSFLEKYAPFILVGITGAMLLLIVIFINSGFGVVANSNIVASQNFLEGIKQLKGVLPPAK